MSTHKEITHWINAQAEAGASDLHGTVFNTATGEAPATVPMANEADVAAAIVAASDASPDWAAGGSSLHCLCQPLSRDPV